MSRFFSLYNLILNLEISMRYFNILRKISGLIMVKVYNRENVLKLLEFIKELNIYKEI